MEYLVEMPTVVHRGSIGLKPADHLVALVHIDRELVAEVALAMLFGPAGIQVFLSALGRCPVGGCRLLLDDLLLLAADLLLGRGDQSRVNDLTATRDVALAQQLVCNTIEQRSGTGFTDAVLERPDRRPVRNIRGMGQPTKALVAHTIQQLVFHLLVRQIVKPLEYQYAYHGISRKRRSAASRVIRARRYTIYCSRQRREVDVRIDVGQRIPQTVDLLPVVVGGEQIGLDGAARLLHGCRSLTDSESVDFTLGHCRQTRFFEVPIDKLVVGRRWFSTV